MFLLFIIIYHYCYHCYYISYIENEGPGRFVMPKPRETNCAPALFLCPTRIVMLWHAILWHAVACRSSTTVIFATQEQAVFNNAKNLLLLDTFQSLNYFELLPEKVQTTAPV